MLKMYQTEWQGIEFAGIAEISATRLAGPEFYQTFYAEFFRRYRGWDQLSTTWLAEKELVANFVLGRAGPTARVLSVGCGLGAMERYMRKRSPHLDLFIHEVSPFAWQWIENEFTDERKFVGSIPECVSPDLRFDLIYLSAVDYALDDEALVELVANIRRLLKPMGDSGECLLISASFEPTPDTTARRVFAYGRKLKRLARRVLAFAGLRLQGQFWGWARTQDEYRGVMRRAGFRNLEDGFIDSARRLYWIAGAD